MNKPIQKILFLSMSAGAGHKRAAEALFLSCQKNYPDIISKNIDITDFATPFFKKITADAYHLTVQKFPFVYKYLYYLTDTRLTPYILNKIYKLLELNNKKLLEIIRDYKPDLIISTHFLIPSIIKRVAKNIPLDMVITDYGLHYFWLTPGIRNFYVASENVLEKLNKLHLTAFKTGLPIHPDFFEEKNLESLKIKYKIDSNNPTILMMSGGFGLKDQSLMIKKILKDFPLLNLIVIAGKNNEKLTKKYLAIKNPENINYQVFDFAEKIDELMKLADIVFTKPGGITLSECLYLNKNIILTKPIPGQEELNEKYFIQNNLAVKINPDDIVSQIKNLLAQKQRDFLQISPTINEKILSLSIKNTRL